MTFIAAVMYRQLEIQSQSLYSTPLPNIKKKMNEIIRIKLGFILIRKLTCFDICWDGSLKVIILYIYDINGTLFFSTQFIYYVYIFACIYMTFIYYLLSLIYDLKYISSFLFIWNFFYRDCFDVIQFFVQFPSFRYFQLWQTARPTHTTSIM